MISSRTPEGWPKHCPVCGRDIRIEPSTPPGDAPCPNCGLLLWFDGWDVRETRVFKPTGQGSIFDVVGLSRLVTGPFYKPLQTGERIVLDLSEVRTLSSSDLAKLAKLRGRLVAYRGKLTLRNLRPDLANALVSSEVDPGFEIEGGIA
jgi:hypothetical protein